MQIIVEFYRSSLEEFIRPILYDGANVKPQYCSEWYREKKIMLDFELQQINRRNEVKKEECRHYIKKWVCHFEKFVS